MNTRPCLASILVVFGVLFMMSATSPALGQGSGETVLLQDNFDAGSAGAWELESGWQVEKDAGNYVLSGEGHKWARLLRRATWFDYKFKTRVKLLTGSIHLNYRVAGCLRYFIGFTPQSVYLAKTMPCGTHTDLASSPGKHELGRWYAIEIVGKGNRVQVYVDGVLRIDYTDAEPLLTGSIAFETLDDSHVHIDDVMVIGPAPPKGFTWIRTGGPLGGLGYDVRMRPDNLDILFVTDAFSGVHKSTDGGKTWVSVNNGITTRTGSSGDAIPIFCLTIDPHNHNIIWAGTQNRRGIFKSTDGGSTWVEKVKGVLEDNGITFRGITIDPRSSNIVYAAAEISSFVWAGKSLQGRAFDLTKGVVYKTTDGGENWTAVWRGDNLARYIWINPRNPDVLYVSTGIFDREAANSDKTKNVAGGAGIVKSADGGKTWKPVNNGLNNLYVGTLFMHPTNPDILLAGAGNNAYREGSGVYLTMNAGETWTQVLSTGLDAVTSVEFALSNPNIAYAGGDPFVYRSEDGGLTWRMMTGRSWGPPGARVGFPIDFQVDPRDANRLFANAYGGGNFLSSDGGKTWQNASQGYTGAEMNTVIIDPTDAATVYAGSRSGFFKSTTGGADWLPLNFPPADLREGAAAAIDPSDPQHVLISDQQQGRIWSSQNGGRNWQTVVNLQRQIESLNVDDNNLKMHGVNTIVFAPSNPKIVYAGFAVRNCVFNNNPQVCAFPSFGVLRSTDGGRTWQQTPSKGLDNLSVLTLTVHPTDPNTLYAATGGKGVLKSTDGGQTWLAINTGLTNKYARTLAIDPTNPQIFYVGTEGAAVFKSSDGGATWKQSAAGLDPLAAIRAIVIDPTKPQVIYAGDWRTGAYRSEDGGARWVQINDGLRMRAVRGMAISSDGKHIYAATQGEGVFRLDVGGEPLAIKPTPEPTRTPTRIPSPTATPLPIVSLPTRTPSPTSAPIVLPTVTPAPTPTAAKGGGGGLCGGVAMLPLAIVGVLLSVRSRRRRVSL